MKRFSLWVIALITTLALPAYNYLTVYRNDGAGPVSFVLENVDSIVLSKIGMDGLEHTAWTTQEFWMQNSVTRIPLDAIDSIRFTSSDEARLSGADLFENVPLEVERFFKSHADATPTDLQVFLAKYGSDLQMEMADSMLIINMPDGYRFDVDWSTSSLLQPSDWSDYDDNSVERFLQDFQEQLGLITTESASATPLHRSKRLEDAPDRLPLFSEVVANNSDEILIKRSILIWALEDKELSHVVNTLNNINSQLQAKQLRGFSLKVMRGRECTLESMKNFDNYGLVFIMAHGREALQTKAPPAMQKGLLCYPCNYVTGKITDKVKHGVYIGGIENDSVKTHYILDADHLKAVLPISLRNTIIWCCVCHSMTEGSEIRKAMLGCPLFAGALRKTTVDPPLSKLKSFAPLFFAGDEAYQALRYTEEEPGYSWEVARNVYVEDHIRLKPIQPQGGQPQASLLLSSEHLATSGGVKAAEGILRAPSTSDAEFGFYYINKKTGLGQKIPLEESSTLSERNAYGFTHYVLSGNTSRLDEGTYEYMTYMTTDGYTQYSNESFEFVKGPCPDGNHPHMIDLGIGVKWACCNVGARTPEEYGGYYAWGELTTKSEYTVGNYEHNVYDSDGDWTGYSFLGDHIGGTAYDAARARWQAPWRMPTAEEMRALATQCTSTWTTQNGVKGRKFVGPNGNSIFLPATGGFYGNGHYDETKEGCYWSDTFVPGTMGDTYAYGMYIYDGQTLWDFEFSRDNGFTVRPVAE